MMVGCEEMVGYSNNFLMDNLTKNNLDRPFVDELGTSTGTWPPYVVMTSTDGGKTLSKLSPFAIHRVLMVLLVVKSLINISLVVTLI